MDQRSYICIDLKSFYASVECMQRDLDPMQAYLVVADESRTDKTICLAVSPALKAYGVPGRPRLFEVKQKLRHLAREGIFIDLVIAPPQMRKYIEISSQIYGIYLKYIAKEDIHVYSIDEVFIDATSYLKMYHMSAHALAQKMIQDVYTTTGITATAGIGTNMYLAKVAMDIVAKHAKADAYGVRIASLDEESYKRLLWDHRPLTSFWRVGKGTAKRLEKYDMYTMGDIARTSLHNQQLLYKLFGKDAEILIDHAWGLETCLMKDIKNYEPDRHSIGIGQVLHEPYSYQKGKTIIKEMLEDLVMDLVKKKLVCDAIVLTVAYDRENVDRDDFDGEKKTDFYGRVLPKSAHGTYPFETFTDSRKKIIEGGMSLYERITNHRYTIRKVNMSLEHVKDKKYSYEQLDMFSDVKKEEEDHTLENVLISIKEKYGKNAVVKASDLQEEATTLERNDQIGGHKA